MAQYHQIAALPTPALMLDSLSPKWLSCLVGFCSKVLASWPLFRKSLIPPAFPLLQVARELRLVLCRPPPGSRPHSVPALATAGDMELRSPCLPCPSSETAVIHKEDHSEMRSHIQRVCLSCVLIQTKREVPATDLQTEC